MSLDILVYILISGVIYFFVLVTEGSAFQIDTKVVIRSSIS